MSFILYLITKQSVPEISLIWFDLIWFNATLSNISAISWRPVLVLVVQ
jgi:hypothetical protein